MTHDVDLTGSSGAGWPLVGRTAELETVLSTYDLMAEGGPIGGVLVIGEAGVGKTRLAREAVQRFEARGCRTIWTTATRSAATVPLGALAHLLIDRERPSGGPGRPLDALASLVAHFTDESGKACVWSSMTFICLMRHRPR